MSTAAHAPLDMLSHHGPDRANGNFTRAPLYGHAIAAMVCACSERDRCPIEPTHAVRLRPFRARCPVTIQPHDHATIPRPPASLILACDPIYARERCQKNR